jgi:hypothetical protein
MDVPFHISEEKYDAQKMMSTNHLVIFKIAVLNLLNQRRPMDRMELFAGQPIHS